MVDPAGKKRRKGRVLKHRIYSSLGPKTIQTILNYSQLFSTIQTKLKLFNLSFRNLFMDAASRFYGQKLVDRIRMNKF